MRLRRALLLAGVIWLGAGVTMPARAGFTVVGRVTWYPTTGYTYGGTWTTAGRTAACGWGIALWSTVTLPDGRVRICEDTGELGPYDVDVYGAPDIPAAMWPYCDGYYHDQCAIEVW